MKPRVLKRGFSRNSFFIAIGVMFLVLFLVYSEVNEVADVYLASEDLSDKTDFADPFLMFLHEAAVNKFIEKRKVPIYLCFFF